MIGAKINIIDLSIFILYSAAKAIKYILIKINGIWSKCWYIENKKIFGDKKLKPCKKEENICNGIIKVMINKHSVSKPK